MIKTVIDYLTKGFGEVCGCEGIRLPRSMPLVISAGYRFYKCRILGVECVIAVAVEEAVHTPRRVQKQLAQVEAELRKPVVFAADRLIVVLSGLVADVFCLVEKCRQGGVADGSYGHCQCTEHPW